MNWKLALDNAVRFIEVAKDFGNKEDLNRLLEPFMWHTAILTATEWDNFFKLRTHSDADWKVKKIADLMYDNYHGINDYVNGIDNKFTTQKLKVGEWHCPLVYEGDSELIVDYIESGRNKDDYENWHIGSISDMQTAITNYRKRISAARCARVSYLTHDGKRNVEKTWNYLKD